MSFHLVVVTKYLNPCLNDAILTFLEREFRRLLESNDCLFTSFNGEDDHVHALIRLHPSIEPAKLINAIKTANGLQRNRKRKDIWEKAVGKYGVDSEAAIQKIRAYFAEVAELVK